MVTLNKKQSNRFIAKMLKKEKTPISKADKKIAKEVMKNMKLIALNNLPSNNTIIRTSLPQLVESIKSKEQLAIEEKYNPFRKDDGLCRRCRKNKATINYANSVLEVTHGFVEHICQQCYDKIKHNNTWYKEGRKEAFDEVIKMINKDINFQEDTMKQRPKYQMGCEWRITGMKLLKSQIKDKK